MTFPPYTIPYNPPQSLSFLSGVPHQSLPMNPYLSDLYSSQGSNNLHTDGLSAIYLQQAYAQQNPYDYANSSGYNPYHSPYNYHYTNSQTNPSNYDRGSYLNPYANDPYSTYGVGVNYTSPYDTTNRLYGYGNHNDPAQLERAKNEVPLAHIGLQQFKYQLAFQDKSEARQLAFDDKSQERQLKLIDKNQERQFFGTLLTSLVPPVLNMITQNQQGDREERIFKFAQENNVATVKKDDHIESLKKRIAQLERKLERYDDDDEDEQKKVKKTKKSHHVHKHDDEDSESRKSGGHHWYAS